MSSFEAYVDPEGVVWLAGEFDLAQVETFTAVTGPTLERQAEVVIDLSRLRFMDSTGVNAIVRLAEGRGGHGVVLRDPRRNVAKLLDLVGIGGRAGIRVVTT